MNICSPFCRTTAAALMDDAEVPLKIKQLILGHSSQDITSKVYTHKTLEQPVEAINSIRGRARFWLKFY